MSEDKGIYTAMFFGIRRGVGTTTLAAQVAMGLQQAGIKTLFLDLDPQDVEGSRASGLKALSTWLDLVPTWLENERLGANQLQQVVHSTEPGVDVLLSPPNVWPQDAQRIQSYRGREFASALFDAAQASGYGVVVVNGQTFPISGFTDALLRHAGWVFFVAGKPELDGRSVLDQAPRLSPLLLQTQRYAIFRSPAPLFTPWVDLMAQAKLRTFFVPRVESRGGDEEWMNSPAVQKAIAPIVREFLPREGRRDWLPFRHN